MPNQKNREDRVPFVPMSMDEIRAMQEAQLSRRKFLQRTGGAAAVVTGAGVALSAETLPAAIQGEDYPPAPYPYEYHGVPDTPEEQPATEFTAFTEYQGAMVEALTARIMPGTADDPGARQAGVVHYIDFILSTNSGLHEPTYTLGPYAAVYEGDSPPEPDDDETIWVHASQISRYGFQAAIAPVGVYQIGLEAIHTYAMENYGSRVTELSEDQLDEIIWGLLDDEIPGFEEFPPSSFFHTLRRHTAEGMFCDPAYGGNQNLVGWDLVGFPGAQRAYSPEEMHSQDPPRPPQALRELPHFHSGVTTPDEPPNVVQPVRGSEDGLVPGGGDEDPGDGLDMGQEQQASPVAEGND